MFSSLKTELLENSFQGEEMFQKLHLTVCMYTENWNFFGCPVSLLSFFCVQRLFMHLYLLSNIGQLADRTKIVLVLTYLAGLFTCLQINVSPAALRGVR